jgi:RNA-binding protein 23/39
MDRERERERRMYARRDERGGPYSPRPRRGSPSYDNAPPRRDDRTRERSPPQEEDPASVVFRTIDRESRSIFVSQIAARITSADLGLFFEDKLGPESVRDARIVTDRLSRRSKGYVVLVAERSGPDS